MELLLSLFIFYFGTLIGSFMNVIVLRLPAEKDVIFERSKCPKCKVKISWYDNIPIFSFIFLKAKCRKCRHKISWQYPLFEIWHGILALVIFFNWPSFSNIDLAIALCHFLIASIFSAHILIDLRYQLLLDSLNMDLVPLILVLMWLSGEWQDRLIGASIGFVFPLTVTWLFYLARGKIGLGGGDIKLFGILGGLFGLKGVVLNIFTSCILGSVLTVSLILFKKIKSDDYIPFGPYIIAVALIQMLFPAFFAQWQNFLIPY